MPKTTTRRTFLGTALYRAAPARPNILWLIGEDLCPDLGCYGNRDVSTPNLDRLSDEGVRFDNVFATGPICSPSRSAIATGVYQTSIDAGNQRSHRDDGYEPPAPIRLFTHLLREAGYFTANLAEIAPGIRGSAKTDFNFKAARVFEGRDWSERKAGQPFYAQANFRHAHRPYGRRPDSDRRRVAPGRVALPPYLPDHPVVRRDWAKYLESIQELDYEVGGALRRLEKENLLEETIVFFFGDNGREMPRDKCFLYDGGIHVPMIVRFPAQYRPAGAMPGSARTDLVSLMDVTATTLQLAGMQIPKYMHSRPIFGPDAKPREFVFSGRDRCDDTPDRVRCARSSRFKYIRNFHPERPSTQWSAYMDVANVSQIVMRQLGAEGKLTPEQARVLAAPRPEEELYDVKADPFEARNLAGDPAHAPQRETMRQALESWMRDTGDQGEVSEPRLAKAYGNWFVVDGWSSPGGCRLKKIGAGLAMECTGRQNLVRCGMVAAPGELSLEFRMRTGTIGKLDVLFETIEENRGGRGSGVKLIADGEWRLYSVAFQTGDWLTGIGFDFGEQQGTIDCRSIQLNRHAGGTFKSEKRWEFV